MIPAIELYTRISYSFHRIPFHNSIQEHGEKLFLRKNVLQVEIIISTIEYT
jgi:hypothetical protein